MITNKYILPQIGKKFNFTKVYCTSESSHELSEHESSSYDKLGPELGAPELSDELHSEFDIRDQEAQVEMYDQEPEFEKNDELYSEFDLRDQEPEFENNDEHQADDDELEPEFQNNDEEYSTSYLESEKENLDRLLLQVEMWMEEGYTFSWKRTITHKGYYTDVKNIDELRENISKPGIQSSGYMVYLNLRPCATATEGLVCIDVDQVDIWERLTRDEMLEELGSPLICGSKRGGHLIYKIGEGPHKKKVKGITKSGTEVDWLTDRVAFVGPGKSLKQRDLVSSNDLSTPPFPLKLSEEKKSVVHMFSTDGNTQGVGKRNTVLFYWISKIYGNYEQKLANVNFINHLYFDPPLEDEECEGIASRQPENESHDDDPMLSRKNVLAATKVNHDREVIVDKMKQIFVFDSKLGKWYEWSGTHWKSIRDHEFAYSVEQTVLNNAAELLTALTPYNKSICKSSCKSSCKSYAFTPQSKVLMDKNL